MPKLSSIHGNKTPVRHHFIKEWMEHKGMSVTDLLTALNDDERSMDLPRVDKSQVYRWFKGQLPQAPMQQRIAQSLGLNEPQDLLRQPEDDWFVQFYMQRSAEERDRLRKMLEAAFPSKTGTND